MQNKLVNFFKSMQIKNIAISVPAYYIKNIIKWICKTLLKWYPNCEFCRTSRFKEKKTFSKRKWNIPKEPVPSINASFVLRRIKKEHVCKWDFRQNEHASKLPLRYFKVGMYLGFQIT